MRVEPIAQSFKMSERNSVVVGSDPTQANFNKMLYKKSAQQFFMVNVAMI